MLQAASSHLFKTRGDEARQRLVTDFIWKQKGLLPRDVCLSVSVDERVQGIN